MAVTNHDLSVGSNIDDECVDFILLRCLGKHDTGGIGADIDYPIHRYFLWAKQAELSLGGASEPLERLGHILARGRNTGT